MRDSFRKFWTSMPLCLYTFVFFSWLARSCDAWRRDNGFVVSRSVRCANECWLEPVEMRVCEERDVWLLQLDTHCLLSSLWCSPYSFTSSGSIWGPDFMSIIYLWSFSGRNSATFDVFYKRHIEITRLSRWNSRVEYVWKPSLKTFSNENFVSVRLASDRTQKLIHLSTAIRSTSTVSHRTSLHMACTTSVVL